MRHGKACGTDERCRDRGSKTIASNHDFVA
jgi:hypothetical protein